MTQAINILPLTTFSFNKLARVICEIIDEIASAIGNPKRVCEVLEKLQRKANVMDGFRAAYAALRASWRDYPGFDAWVARANNASFGAQAAYDDLVPGFLALFEREGQDFNRFYDAVRALGEQPPEQRTATLQELGLQTRLAEQTLPPTSPKLR